MALGLTVGTLVSMTFDTSTAGPNSKMHPALANGGYGVIEVVSRDGNFYLVRCFDYGHQYRVDAVDVSDATGQKPPSGHIPKTHTQNTRAD
jgi:hypothetical protein